MTLEEKTQEYQDLVNKFEATSLFRDSFEKFFIFINHSECWQETRVLLIHLDAGNAHECDENIDLMIGAEGAEVTEQLGGDGSGSEWSVEDQASEGSTSHHGCAAGGRLDFRRGE